MENGPTSLSSFVRSDLEHILARWESFARSIAPARKMAPAALRDHASGMLLAIADDLESSQTEEQQEVKSRGQAPRKAQVSDAERHGAGRAAAGFSVDDTVSEFRALRASVLHCWVDRYGPHAAIPNGELIRFNESIDQALTESLQQYTLDKDEVTRRFDTLLSSSPDLQCIVAPDGTLLYANRALASLLRMPADTLVGRNLAEFECGDEALARLRQVIQQRLSLTSEASCSRDGEATAYRYALIPVLGGDGAVESVAMTARNISELKASEEQIRRNAYYDSLTDLPNRILFRDRLELELRHAARAGHTLALLFIDLDGFKEVNDRSGHAAGDQLLRESGQRIASCVRTSDTVARLGGDEFTVILPDVTHDRPVETLARQILDQLARPYQVQHKDLHVSGSIGITFYPQDAVGADDLLRNADQAMFTAKNAGRNRYCFFTAEMRDSAWARLRSLDQLRQALPKRELAVYYQPIVELPGGAIVKAEALLRWQHPESGLVLPHDFIGLAEESGLISEIGAWVLQQALVQARSWSAMGGSPFQISVNKSAVEFMSRSSAGAWQPQLADLARAGTSITVELTEGVMLNDSPLVRDRLNQLQAAGVKLAIDDFGIGYSSMAYLKKFKVDFVKIDQSFVRDMVNSAESRIFAETIIVMAHRLGLKVIAEGVETEAQRAWLCEAQCDYAQGFLFAEAVPAERFEQMLRAGAQLH